MRLALQLARAVAAAHALKVVHRDLKPENLFLTRDGTLKVLDFGLAKLRPEAAVGPEEQTLDASAPGRLIGTVAYMAPEQVRGDPVDERTDLFAIGVLLHEMLGGCHPFRRRTGAETLAAILREPPVDAGHAVSPSLERLVLRCLEKEPHARFQTAADLAFALETVGGDSSPAAALLRPEGPAGGPSIAVLPFADMSPARDQDHLCEGIAEELINGLTHIEGLRVAARSSSFQFRGSAVDIRAVGARLGVSAVLEGSVRKAGDRLRVAVQLIDVADGYHRWSERFDGSFEDVFAIEDEIAERVATALRGVLSPREKEALRRPETATETYEYFLRGRRLLHTFRRESIEAAREMFERAIQRDPGYAPAHAGLADVHSWVYEWWGGDDSDLEAADAASRRALELGPDLADAHASRGFVLSNRRQYEEAAREFEEALRLNPNSYDALYYYGRACFAAGQTERSATLFRRAGEARREDFQSLILLAQSLAMMRREDEALEANREGIRAPSGSSSSTPPTRALSRWGPMPSSRTAIGTGLCAGRSGPSSSPPTTRRVLINGACLRARAGLKEEALGLLERTFARGFGKRDWIEKDPDYDPLRDEPRFQALLERLR